jgi:hypothetical protein
MRDPLGGELTIFLNPDERADVSVGVSSVSGISSSTGGGCEWFGRFFSGGWQCVSISFRFYAAV